MSKTALGVKMREDGLAVVVTAGDGEGLTITYELSHEQAHKFGMTMMLCAQQANANEALRGAK